MAPREVVIYLIEGCPFGLQLSNQPEVTERREMAKIPVVDLGRCSDCEACLETCPEVFKRNEAGYIEVAALDSYPYGCVQEAIKYCPADCISWEEQ